MSAFLLLAFLAGFCSGEAQQAAPLPPAASSEEQLIEHWMQPLPAGVQLSIAIIDGDSVRFVGVERTAEGLRRIDNRRGVFEIGSITKVFTATLLARRLQSGALRLDDPVAPLLPFALKEPGRNGVAVTLRHLATHTSGMEHQPPGLGRHALFHGHSDDPFRDFDQAKYEHYLREEMKLLFTPGEKYSYSNMGMALVARVLTEKSGKPYESMLQEEIFRPLGMNNSSTDLARLRSLVVPGVGAPNWEMGALVPAGGIRTTAEDFAKFVQAQFGDDPAIALTHEPRVKIEERYWAGLGWHIIDRKDGARWLNHGGGMGGYTAVVNVDVAARRGVIVLSNLGNAHKLADNISLLARDLLARPASSGHQTRARVKHHDLHA